MQIYDSVVDAINEGKLQHGSKLPSINNICYEHKLARETVIKSFNLLKTKGIIESVHGKGFYISSTDTRKQHKIFLLLDTLSAYKENFYNAFLREFGEDALIDTYFHHFNIDVFEGFVQNNLGKYSEYIISPFENSRIGQIIESLPQKNLYLIDRNYQPDNAILPGVFQDFENDIYQALCSAGKSHEKYSTFNFLFRNTNTIPPSDLLKGFEKFCNDHQKEYEVFSDFSIQTEVKKGNAYIVIDDDDLVNTVLSAENQQLVPGKDVGIVSYNETSLKKVISGGISVISTDFRQMGINLARMIMNNDQKLIINPCSLIDRGSY